MGNRSRARALSVIFTCMLSSMLSGARGGGKPRFRRNHLREAVLAAVDGHLHAVPGSEVFVDDLAAG